MKHEMIGERRVSRFDPHLAERIEAWDREQTIKEEAERLRREREDRLKPKAAKPAVENLPQGENLAVDLEGRLIDLNPSDNGSYKTQDQWIAYFNGRNEIMVSMPDVYMAGKLGGLALLESLRKDFTERWIVTSTRIIYDTNLDAKIIHNYGSNLVQPVEHDVVIPEYRLHLLKAVLNTQEGLMYLRALFGTNDNAGMIRQTLKNLSVHGSSKTRVRTPGLDGRKNWPQRAASFGYFGVFRVNDFGVFRVLGDDYFHYDGRSRGVRYVGDSER